jgi:phosphate transport system substrate-binding protein
VRRLVFSAAVLLVSVLTALAQLPPASPAANAGSIIITGDQALLPLTQNITALYQLEGFMGTVNTTASVVADAFVGLCAGNVDIVLAARLITVTEQNACLANGVTPLGFQVGTDALIIVVSPQNAFLQNLSTQQLRQAFSSAFNWVEVDTAFPPTPINRYLPDQTTGEFQFFVNALFGGDPLPALTGTNTTTSADFNQLLQAIAQDTAGIGILPASIANRNSSLARPVLIDNIAPNTQAVTNGQYPLTRPLYLYTTENNFRARPTVADFLNYYLTNAPTEVGPLGLYPASDTLRASAINAWLAAAGLQATPTPFTPLPTLALPTTLDAAPTPQPLLISPTAAPTLFDEDTQTLLINARADLETLASNILGVRRPDGWSGLLDTTNPQLPLFIRLDLETLAGNTLGIDRRPAGWIGAVPSTQYAIARDIRYDLELLADALLESRTRPQGWVGADPLLRCDRATQALAVLLERSGLFTLDVDPAAFDYCQQVASAASVFAEINLLNLPLDTAIFAPPPSSGAQAARGTVRIDTRFAVAFFNRAATQRAGVIPEGTSVRPIGRSPSRFSNMMLVEGEGFLLFVDYNDTTLSTLEFRALPSSEQSTRATFCSAEFCQ